MSGWICSYGGDHSATHFCACTKSLPKLCATHEVTHKGDPKFKGSIYHSLYPIEALIDFQSPGYLGRLGQRSAVKDLAISELVSNLETINECCQAFTQRIDGIMGKLSEYRNAMLKELQLITVKLREEIEVSLQEVESVHYLDNPFIKCKYTSAIREFVPGQQLLLFRYQIETEIWPLDVNNILRFEVGENARDFRNAPAPQMTTQEKTIDTLQKLASTQEGHIASLKKQIVALEGLVSTREGHIATLEDLDITRKGHIDSLNSQIVTLQEHVETLEGLVSIREGHIATLEDLEITQKGHIASLEKQIAAQQVHIATLEELATTRQEHIHALQRANKK